MESEEVSGLLSEEVEVSEQPLEGVLGERLEWKERAEGGKAWPFFLFQMDLPDVASDSESEKLNELPQLIGVLLSCFCRTASSLWRPASLASSSVILELACTNFLSAFQQQSRSAEAFSSTNLTLSIRLLWQSLYHSTFLSDSEDASSSIWQTMFGHVIQMAF